MSIALVYVGIVVFVLLFEGCLKPLKRIRNTDVYEV
jgi:hypothetical protein